MKDFFELLEAFESFRRKDKQFYKMIIPRFIEIKGGMSFVDIERIFDIFNFDYEGRGAIGGEGGAVFWFKWNDEARNIVKELVDEKIICFKRVPDLHYLLEGFDTNMPFESDKKDDDEHFFVPVILKLQESKE